MITAVILTNNAEKTIEGCFRSVAFCSERIVIDDQSNDKTVEIARKLKAKVYIRRLNDDFATQRNYGLSKAKNKWVLFVDDDETISSELKKEILRQMGKDLNQISAFYLKRKDRFLGSWLNYGETNQVRLIRLAKKKAGQWQGRVHEAWQIKGEIKHLKAPLLHIRDLEIGEFIERLNGYAELYSLELYQQGRKELWFKIFVFPPAKFFYNYFICLGFLDGFPGLAMAWLMSWHSLLVRVRLRLLWR